MFHDDGNDVVRDTTTLFDIVRKYVLNHIFVRSLTGILE
jgi:hypothetical protein